MRTLKRLLEFLGTMVLSVVFGPGLRLRGRK
jgi:hypothetical protein